MDDLFYKAFEERYYAPREVIKNKLRVYKEFVEPLKHAHVELNALDLGCGRGEWLELMTEYGFTARGVDIDEGMLSDSRERNLSVAKQDALEYIKKAPNNSHVLITAFHVVEHLTLEYLFQLIDEAQRVLKPCGLLIMETPNPENLFVGVNNFYLDPTHVRPLPMGLLSFITEYTGYKRVKCLRLQENKKLLSNESIDIINVINGVSPDYAVIAQKDGPQENLALFEDAFAKEYGLSLLDLGEAYEKNKAATINKLYLTLESQSQQLLHLRRVIQLVKLIKWLIKLPSRGIKWFIHRIKNLFKKMLSVLFRIANRIPFLKKIGKSIITRIPALESKLKRTIQLYKQASFPVGSESYVFMTDTENLTPRARCIYADLIAAYKRQGKEISK